MNRPNREMDEFMDHSNKEMIDFIKNMDKEMSDLNDQLESHWSKKDLHIICKIYGHEAIVREVTPDEVNGYNNRKWEISYNNALIASGYAKGTFNAEYMCKVVLSYTILEYFLRTGR